MAFKDTWQDIIDGESEIVGKDINDIAQAVIDVENDKEDKANKINTWDELGNDTNGEVKYPTVRFLMDNVSQAEDNAKAHADGLYGELNQRVTTNEESIAGAFVSIQSQERQITELKGDIEACGDFELIELTDSLGNPLPKPYKLTEDATQISHALNGQYKELYIFLKMPAQADVSTNTSKARVRMKIGNINIYDQGNFLTDNYSADWYMVCTVKAYGTRCYSQVWFGKYYTDDKGAINPFAINPSTGNYNGAVVPHANLNNPYLDSFTVSMASNPVGGRYFPNGTIYELWGVKA